MRWIPLIALLFSSVVSAERGLTVTYKESEALNAPVAGQMQLYGNSYALIIGIDQYTNGWPRLSMAVKDAEEVATEMRKRGFQVTFKTNLKSAELESTFKEFYALKGEDPEARLFVWYAGHGHTMAGEGFLVPADAPRPEVGGRFRLSALSMRRFGEFVRLAQSKHAYAVFDACFAGTVFTTQRTLPPVAITRATTLPVRQFLTSGDVDQKVSDDGRFRKLFLRAIRGEERSDANGDSYVTATELGLFLSDRLTNLTQSRQTPRYGKLNDEDYDRGDFVFVATSTVPRPSDLASPITQSTSSTHSLNEASNAEKQQWFLLQKEKSIPIAMTTEALIYSDISLPQVTDIKGTAKFIELIGRPNFFNLGYKIAVDIKNLDQKNLPEKYKVGSKNKFRTVEYVTNPIKEVYYEMNFVFVLKDKDGFTLATIESKNHFISSGKQNTFQEKAKLEIPENMVKAVSQVFVEMLVKKCVTCRQD